MASYVVVPSVLRCLLVVGYLRGMHCPVPMQVATANRSGSEPQRIFLPTHFAPPRILLPIHYPSIVGIAIWAKIPG